MSGPESNRHTQQAIVWTQLSNPPAAMTFTLHLLRIHSDLSEGALHLLNDASAMLERISTTVRGVLAESSDEAAGQSLYRVASRPAGASFMRR